MTHKIKFIVFGMVVGISISFMFISNGYSQNIHGTVFDEEGNAVGGVRVSIPSSGLATFTDGNGTFTLSVDSSGNYTIEFERLGYYKISRDVNVKSEGLILNPVMIVDPISLPSVIVTAKPQPSVLGETPYSVSVIEGRELERFRGQNVISSLARSRGVTAISNGVISQKPVIRGLGFQRVVILENGIRHETQQWDDDDTPGIDAMGDQRIEIVRGPGSVLYGSDALGGVINIMQNYASVPHSESSRMSGKLGLNGFSNNRQIAGALSLNGFFDPLSYNLQFSLRKSGNVRTPTGVLNNTGVEETNGHGNISFTNNLGDVRMGFSHFDQVREILPELEEEGEEPYQTTKHSRFFLTYKNNLSPLKWDISSVYQINDVAEYEDEKEIEPRINLRLNTLSFDVKTHHNGIVGSIGTIGTNFQFQRNKTLGEESLIPAYRQYTVAGFLFEEFQGKNFNYSTGVRYDLRLLKTDFNAELEVPAHQKTFQALTASFGGLWHVSRYVTLMLNGGKGWRSPVAEELFINGLEEGSLRYKIGNRNLRPEESFSLEAGSRFSLSHVSGNVSVFYNHINHYIYMAATGQVDTTTSAEKFEHRQANVNIWGSELDVRYHMLSALFISAGMDLIWGKNMDTHTWLPLFPPHRIILGIEYRPHLFSFLKNPRICVDAKIYFDQTTVDIHEDSTPGYTLFDLMIGFDLMLNQNPIYVDMIISNIFNKSYRDHLSLYKKYALNPGIDAALKISIPFKVIN